MKPKRIQRKRTKGWRMPEGAVYVGRPSKWGNPFVLMFENEREEIMQKFRRWMLRNVLEGRDPRRRPSVEQAMKELRGKDLVCWCRLDQPCHADVLLEIANA